MKLTLLRGFALFLEVIAMILVILKVFWDVLYEGSLWVIIVLLFLAIICLWFDIILNEKKEKK